MQAFNTTPTTETAEKQLEFEAKQNAPVTQEELAALISLYTAKGVPAQLWPDVQEDNLRFSCLRYRIQSKLEPVLITKLPFNQAADMVKVPEELTSSFNNLRMNRRAYYCVTEAEEWWPYECAFLVDTPETLLRMCAYKYILRTGDLDALSYIVKAKRGRPAKEGTTKRQRDEEYSKLYHVWKQQCADRRHYLEQLRLAYGASLEETERLRLVWKEAEAEGAPPMPQRTS